MQSPIFSSTKLSFLYTIESLSSFAGSLIGVFVPVYLLSLGLSVRDIMVFSLFQTIAGFFAIITTALASRHFSLKIIMMARIPVLLTFMVLLVSAKYHHVPIELLALLQGYQFVLYFLPLHVFFTGASSEKAVGRQLGLLGFIPKVVCLLAPILAGFMIFHGGFNAVFILAAVFYVGSGIVMLGLPNYKSVFSLNITSFQELYKTYKTYFWLEVIENIQEELDLVIWPLIVYLTVHSTLQTGAAATIIGATSATFTYLIGRLADKHDKFWLLRFGGFSMLLLWIWRLFPLNIFTIIIISAFVGIAGVLIDIPFDSLIYNLARNNDPRHFIPFREIPIGIARLLVYGVAVIFANDLSRLFWFAIAAYAIFAVIPRFNTVSSSNTALNN